MSRIGKKVIILPEKTELKVSGDLVSVKGPLGELSRTLHPVIEVKINGREVTVNPKKITLESRALWGAYASHITNMILGVNKLFEKKLILEGIGFKSEVKGSKIVLALGFSHPVEVPIPEGLKVTAEKNIITISGRDKELVGQFTARLRSLKKPEPYKGKGMRYDTEIIRRKQGKKSV
ncbi:MAG: 50S ribosomal protein L6 [Candidatus Zambryskibacteria bacterium RIFCSPLOWO2_12_FULL_45_14]|uniref:50S ribosomal protein L6 n=2 Tax=Candidatus Zambryskiibacteriota TaxID=1817925 RepID=A0A1G2UJX7_9BACT|nr:MAG: 50S ribosomal protein L6 [Candidatus Zambryskibacteria bacterium RIFCSPLOWO2_02_FULL_44_12b]OHB14557.1 MAG: 50S ribosomal protein L6 [Candidatus Zambryskibacteria bacterium RIFCSPLOWO2_12_FULL_45_14]